MRLVHLVNGVRLAGVIIETEAYGHEEDLGCHCRHGRTPRTAVMYGPPGKAYVYFTYGMHWLFNVVVEPEGLPAAVLIRALYPVEGVPEMVAHRRAAIGKKKRIEATPEKDDLHLDEKKPGIDHRWLTGGPARLCQALCIGGDLNGVDLCSPQTGLFIESGEEIPDWAVTLSPRVGLNTVPEPWKSLPWRFLVAPEALRGDN